jgi:hypothetical protein
MSEEKKDKRNFLQRIKHRYRIVIMNDDTFEENFSLRLTPLGFFILLGSITIVMTILVSSIIAFTPLREYIPGYADVTMRRELVKLTLKSDSLEQSLFERTAFMDNIANVLKGNIKSDSTQGIAPKGKKQENLAMNSSVLENELKKNIESQDQYSLAYGTESNKSGISNFFFFSPLKGVVSDQFKAKDKHFGIDIVGPENEAIKSTLDGTLRFQHALLPLRGHHRPRSPSEGVTVPTRQIVVFLALILVLFVAILELARRRVLRVEYSWLWIASCLTTVLLILRYDLLVKLTDFVGAVVPTSTLFFLCILYLALLCLHYSIRISALTHQVKDLAQEVALLRMGLARPDNPPAALPEPRLE